METEEDMDTACRAIRPVGQPTKSLEILCSSRIRTVDLWDLFELWTFAEGQNIY